MNQDRLDLKINEIVQQKPELLTGPQRYSLTRIPDAMNVSEGSGDEHGDGEQSIDDVEAQVNPKHEREEEEEESEEDVMEPGRQEQRDTESM